MFLTINIKKYLFAFSITICTLFVVSCNSDSTSKVEEGESVNYVKGVYLCPMDCENSKSDQPGKCPVCNMDLVKEIEVEEITADLEHSMLMFYFLS